MHCRRGSRNLDTRNSKPGLIDFDKLAEAIGSEGETNIVVQTTKSKAPKVARAANILAAAKKEVEKRKCLSSLSYFFKKAWSAVEPGNPLDWNWHIEVICDHVQSILEGWLQRKNAGDPNLDNAPRNALLNVPPGSLKSRILSVMAPAWMWAHDPTWTVICLSANPDLAGRDGAFCLELIQSDWYQQTFNPDWTIKRNKDGVTHFENTKGGWRRGKGLNAAITGQRADALFVDDPHDAEKAQSDKIREGTINRWSTSVRNRVNDLRTSVRIGIMQRVHEADWAQYVIDQGWPLLKIRTEYNPDPKLLPMPTWLGWTDPRTVKGESIHPERMTPEVIADEKSELGEYNYAAQHDQDPAPSDGGLFKKAWWKIIQPEHLPAKWDQKILSVDCTFGSLEDTASRVALGVVGVTGPKRIVVDLDCRVGTYLQTIARIDAMMTKHPDITAILVEMKANGASVIENLKQKYPFVIPYDPKRDSKFARAVVIQPEVQGGAVGLLAGSPWIDEFIHEFAVFPRGKYDDMVDMLSQLLNYLRGTPGLQRLIAAYGKRPK